MPVSASGMYTAEAEGGVVVVVVLARTTQGLRTCMSVLGLPDFGSLWVKVEFHSLRITRKAIRNRRES